MHVQSLCKVWKKYFGKNPLQKLNFFTILSYELSLFPSVSFILVMEIENSIRFPG